MTTSANGPLFVRQSLADLERRIHTLSQSRMLFAWEPFAPCSEQNAKGALVLTSSVYKYTAPAQTRKLEQFGFLSISLFHLQPTWGAQTGEEAIDELQVDAVGSRRELATHRTRPEVSETSMCLTS